MSVAFIHPRFAAAILPTLRDTCDVITPAKGASDGRFGWAAGTDATTYNDIPCLVDARPGQQIEESIQQRLGSRAFATIYLEPDKTVTMSQQIERGSETYEVIGSPVVPTNSVLLAVPCARNTP